MEIKEIEIDKIIPDENNPKKHSEDQVEKIAKSIKRFGFKIPVLLNEDFKLIAGHGRVLAAKKLKLKKIPCIFVRGLTEVELKALMIADNKVGESEWDMEKLFGMFDIIKSGDKSLLSITGFNDTEINNLNLDYGDLSSELSKLELEHLKTIEFTAKFKNEKDFAEVRDVIIKIKKANGLASFTSDYSNGVALKLLCEDEEENGKALKILAKKYKKKHEMKNGK